MGCGVLFYSVHNCVVLPRDMIVGRQFGFGNAFTSVIFIRFIFSFASGSGFAKNFFMMLGTTGGHFYFVHFIEVGKIDFVTF